MPYLKTVDRARVCPDGTDGMSLAENKAELNFEFCVLADDYIREHGRSYQVISDAVGALEDAAAEMRRTVLAVYEEEKRRANGEVFSDYTLGRG